MRVRVSGSVLAGVLAATVLVGCSTEGAPQQDLAARLESLDGVISVAYELDSSIFHLSTHFLTIALDRELSEGAARQIAQATCKPEVDVSTLVVTTDDDISRAQTVLSVQGPSRTTSCIKETAMVGFARAVAAMNEMGPDFDGRFNVSLGGPDGPDADETLYVSTSSSDRTRLLDALVALRAQSMGTSLDFVGEWAEDGDEYAPGLPTLTVRLSPDFDLARASPLIERAHELGVGDVVVDDDTVSIELVVRSAPDSEAELTAFAEEAGVILTVIPAS